MKLCQENLELADSVSEGRFDFMMPDERILNWIEEIGGGYVWDADVAAINLLEVDLCDDDATRLRELDGIQQVAINAHGLSSSVIRSLAEIPGLSSLVLSNAVLEPEFLLELEAIGPRIELI
ncbi:MAG: hypothetical protein P1U86_08430 [Verrucomicrobiales bacterium]|nr:hypothetical protein [Verrucomicrobiales bacterium]